MVDIEDLDEKLEKILRNQKRDHELLEQILRNLPGQATGFTITTEIEKKENDKMSKAVKHAVSFELMVNGKVKYTASLVDPNGNPGSAPVGLPPLVWTVDQPNAISLAPDPADTSGLNLVQIGTGVAAATGVIASASTTFPNATSPTSVAADPVDVNPDVATGFKISESAA